MTELEAKIKKLEEDIEDFKDAICEKIRDLEYDIGENDKKIDKLFEFKLNDKVKEIAKQVLEDFLAAIVGLGFYSLMKH